MNDDTQVTTELEDIREGDILFNCPHCDKSMAIDPAGAGLEVPCASCGKPVQVPIPDADTPLAPATPATPAASEASPEDLGETIRQLDAALSMANAQIDRLVEEKESLKERRAFLESLRETNAQRLESIAAELSTVQTALDRALTLLADARAEKPV